MSTSNFTMQVPQGAHRVTVLGPGDRNLKILRETLGVHILAREDLVQVSGDPACVAAARTVLEHLADRAERGIHLAPREVIELLSRALSNDSPIAHLHHSLVRQAPATPPFPSPASASETHAMSSHDRHRTVGLGAGYPARAKSHPTPPAAPSHLFPHSQTSHSSGSASHLQTSAPPWRDHLDVYADGRPIRAQSANQQAYLDSIRDFDLVFGLGPAGTGKTYLAVAAAVHLLRAERTRKIILVRPAVEAGERLGFLPGGFQEKVNPYLRPLLDALHDMMDFNTIKRFMFNDVVEVIPLAYMRGRTLNHSVIILDEAQNTTRSQMQMFLTRMGHGSKMIVTGDVSQIDLPDPTESGLIDAVRRLRRVPGVGLCALDQADIVRHPLVQRIVQAYGPTPVQSQPASPWAGDPRALLSEPDPDSNPATSVPGS